MPDKICNHEWGTDGQHFNVFCKKCYCTKPEDKLTKDGEALESKWYEILLNEFGFINSPASKAKCHRVARELILSEPELCKKTLINKTKEDSEFINIHYEYLPLVESEK